MLVRAVQLAKVYSPKPVTLLGISTFTRLSQCRNAEPPILVTLSGIFTLLRPVLEKAEFAIFVTLFGISFIVFTTDYYSIFYR